MDLKDPTVMVGCISFGGFPGVMDKKHMPQELGRFLEEFGG